ncbi:MAG: GIY-YIG nuclease family protein [Rhodocyclaceae bacterium]|nr:GIY-YIG nuclease family protein [Rhodocyclaceae bacterium]
MRVLEYLFNDAEQAALVITNVVCITPDGWKFHDCICATAPLIESLSNEELGAAIRSLVPEMERSAARGEVPVEGYCTAGSKNLRPPRSSNVYLMRANGIYKIGVGVNVEARRKALSTASGYAVEIVRAWPTESSEEARRLELMLHNYFRVKRLNGEWFELTPADVGVLAALMSLRDDSGS